MATSPCFPTTAVSPEEEHSLCRTTKKSCILPPRALWSLHMRSSALFCRSYAAGNGRADVSTAPHCPARNATWRCGHTRSPLRRRDTRWHRHLSHPSRPHLAAPPGGAGRQYSSHAGQAGHHHGEAIDGADVAAALGATTRRDGYLEGAHDLVTWCVGHLVELDEPEAYDPAWKQWRPGGPAALPAPFTYHPDEPTRDQFTVITRLLGRADVTTIVNAADAGREGS